MSPYDSSDERASARAEPRFTDSAFAQDSQRDSYRDSSRPDPYRRAEEEPDPRLDPRYEERPSQYRRESQFADDEYHPREDERTYGERDQRPQQSYFEDDGPLSAQEDDAYDDPPRKRGRSGLLTAVTLIGCAMIGTAGAYGYRTYYSNPSSNRVPPVISAETSPTKVVSASDGPTGKFIQDRVRDVTPPERVVPREEEPVELRTPSSPSRVPSQSSAFPPPPSGNLASGSAGGGASAYTSPGPGSGNTPDAKRVRTVTIRPDGQPGGNPPAAATPPKQAPAAKAPSRGPISLDPQESSAPPSPPAPRERVAAAPPPIQSVQPPAPRATAVPSDASGGYMVQLSSQRSEAEAQASFKALQGKFPDQLSDRSAIIRRVDLGSKGIYFRALVGPFGSSDEAATFCTELKAAGGQCLIPRN